MFPPQNTTGTVSGICTDSSWQGDLYGKPNDEIVQFYGLTTENIEKTGRFLFTNGGLDPVAAVGPLSLDPPLTRVPYRNASRVVLMPNIAHAEELSSYYVEPKGLNPYNDNVRNSLLIGKAIY